ncbi:MAG: hopanoid biosynthesis associated radical SAM protein HpnH, partial [Rhizobiales bacterium]|nr:hopanoid biosynthesis associated radical SAM protein HpnH [Hyphomicrobiales bacterium]
PEIDLSNQRPAQYIFAQQVQKTLTEIRRDEAAEAAAKAAAKQKTSTAA